MTISSFSSSALPYTNVSNFRAYSYPYAAYSPYANPSALNLAAYPNTLSTSISSDLFQDFSHLAVDPASLHIIPDDIFESPKQPDNSQHDLNPFNGFSYHTSNEDLLGNQTSSSYFPFPTSLSRHFLSPLFTDPLNSQYILPDGRIGELQTVASRAGSEPISNKEANRIIYEAKKARGDEVVRDIFGREYTPETEFNISDSQDFVDESFRGQVNDYLQYNQPDPVRTNVLSDIYSAYTQNPVLNNSFSGLPSGNFLSDVLQSNTGLESPLMQTGNPMIDNPFSISETPNIPLEMSINQEKINNPTPKLSELNLLNISIDALWDNILGTNRGFQNLDDIRVNVRNLKPLSVSTRPIQSANLMQNNIINQSLVSLIGNNNPLSPRFNPLAFPFNVSRRDPYQGTFLGEYYHNIEYLKRSFEEITQVKPKLLGSKFEQAAFDSFADPYGWTNNSPYYQDYIIKHVFGTHGGVHDVFTPRGFLPSNLLPSRSSIFI